MIEQPAADEITPEVPPVDQRDGIARIDVEIERVRIG